MTHGGLALVLAAFLLLAAGASTTAFGDLRAAAAALSPATRNAVFCLALIGFGSKAGLVPLHVWLPRAHPAAPSHVSALMSGVMIKMGVYGLLRVGLDLLGGGPAWWGGAAARPGRALGAARRSLRADGARSQAAARLLDVENIGIIFIGLGAGFLFQSYGLPLAAALAFVGGALPHAEPRRFKGLLFLGAGAVLHATGTRNMEELGGLIKRHAVDRALLPRRAPLAISALPPLNGFVSRVAAVPVAPARGSAAPRPRWRVLMPLAVGMLALTSGLAAACFVKAFGITFLAIPRSAEAGARARGAAVDAGRDGDPRAGVRRCFGLAPSRSCRRSAPSLAGHGGLPAAAPRLHAGGLPLSDARRLRSDVAGARGAWGSSLVVAGAMARGPALRRGAGGSASARRGAAGASSRRRAWSTPRPRSPSRCAASSPSCTGRPRISPSTSIRSRGTSCSRSSTGREIVPWFERYLYAPVIALGQALVGARARRCSPARSTRYLAYLVAALVLLLGWLVVTGQR